MQTINDFLNLNQFGIESTKKEKCPACNYGMRITVVVNGKEHSRCKYCEDKELAKQLNVSLTDSEKERNLLLSRISYFDRIPNDLKHVLLNDYIAKTKEQTAAKELAKNYIWNFDGVGSLVFSGDPGIGKSHIAVAIKKALSKEHTTLFLKSTELLGFIRDSYNGANHTEQDVFDICREVDLLVIDDLGAEYSKESENESWASDIIYRVLDSRLGKSNIITTNYAESLLEEKYGLNGKRITSRMSEKAEKIRIFGKDMRKNEGN